MFTGRSEQQVLDMMLSFTELLAHQPPAGTTPSHAASNTTTAPTPRPDGHTTTTVEFHRGDPTSDPHPDVPTIDG